MSEGPKLSQPVLPGPAGSDYENYLRTDELLALQKSPDEWAHRDELLFQTVHQSSELWLKLGTTEVDEAAGLLERDEIAPAIRLLRRAVLCLQYVTSQLEMLNQMSPWEYSEIRVVLGHGSGFDSPGFRRVPVVTQRDLDGTIACQDQRSSICRWPMRGLLYRRRLSDENPVTSPAGVLVVAVPIFVMPRWRNGSRGGRFQRLAAFLPESFWRLRQRRRKIYRGSERESRSTNIDGFHC